MNNLILITGGTGAMGSVLVRKLSERGFRLRVLTLPGDTNADRLREAYGVDVRFGTIASADDCHGLCDGVTAVIHLAAVIIANDHSLYTSVNAGGTRNIVAEAAAAGGVSHFIHVSSASVLYPKATPYSISKRLAEDFVRTSDLSWTIVRPTLVYGKQGGQEFDMFLSYLRRFPAVPFIGSGSALKRPVFVDDVVDGLVKLACMKTGKNNIYNFSGATSVSILDFSRLCLTLLGKETKPIVHLPVWLCMGLAGIMNRLLKNPPLKWSVIAGVTQDANLDPAEAIRDIGYSPRGIEQMLPECFPRNL
jgi:nucleoside-diphosphate-sugar epimerase